MTDDSISIITETSAKTSLSKSLAQEKEDGKMNEANEQKWVIAVQAGNIHAFELLFNAYKNRIHLFIKNILVSNADAEELTQEVFVKIWTNRAKIDSNKSICAYIYAVAKNIVYDFLRKKLNQKKYIETIVKEEGLQTENIEQDIFYTETFKLIQALVSQLPAKRKRIFELSRFEGKTYRQIARKLNISENTVDTQIRHALKFLRQHMNHLPDLTGPFFVFFLEI